jgi:hypothetical protein
MKPAVAKNVWKTPTKNDKSKPNTSSAWVNTWNTGLKIIIDENDQMPKTAHAAIPKWTPP